MKQKLLLVFVLATQSFFAQWSQVGSDIDSDRQKNFFGTSIAINDLGDIVAVGAPDDDESSTIFNNGVVTVYKKNEANEWVQYGNEIIGEAADDQSGYSLSMNAAGTIVAIGSIVNNDGGLNAGHVRVYEYNAGTWTKIGTDLDGVAGDYFGSSVSLNQSGTLLAVGAPGNAANTGLVRVYEYTGGNWVQQGLDLSGVAGDNFGTAVSINQLGTKLAVGAPNNATNTGLVKIYEYSSSTWSLHSELYGETSEDYFGTTLELNGNGNTIIVGAVKSDGAVGIDTGHVSVYEYISSSWSQIGSNIEGEGSKDEFGNAVSINTDGSIIAIGSKRNGDNATKHGHVRIFRNESGTWTQLGGDINGEANYDESGISVDLNSTGFIVSIGAALNDGAKVDAGHARIFEYEEIVLTNKSTTIDGLVINFSNGSFSSNLPNIKLEIRNILGQNISNKSISTGVYLVLAQDNFGATQLFKIFVK